MFVEFVLGVAGGVDDGVTDVGQVVRDTFELDDERGNVWGHLLRALVF